MGIQDKLKEKASLVGQGVTTGALAATDTAKKAVVKSKETIDVLQKAVLGALDQNGDGQIDSVEQSGKTSGFRGRRKDLRRYQKRSCI